MTNNNDIIIDMATFRKKNKENRKLMKGAAPVLIRKNTFHIDAFTKCVISNADGEQSEIPCIQLIKMILAGTGYIDNPEILGDCSIKLND